MVNEVHVLGRFGNCRTDDEIGIKMEYCSFSSGPSQHIEFYRGRKCRLTDGHFTPHRFHCLIKAGVIYRSISESADGYFCNAECSDWSSVFSSYGLSLWPLHGAHNMAAKLPPNIWRNGIGSDPWNEKSNRRQTDLAGVVVDDEALVPAVEVLVGVDLDAELLQHRLVGPLAHSVHGGAHVIQDAHDAWRILQSQAGSFTFAPIGFLLAH